LARIDEIVDGIYRISTTYSGGLDFQFNQFLIDDERPALIHTGMYAMYDDVREAVAEVLDPGKLEYVILLHFEADECGGMDRFLEGAPSSTLACSAASVQLNLSGWNYRGRVEGQEDGDVIELGQHKLRFLETPHVHHSDSMMLFEERTRSVFPSDLFIQPGDQPPVVTEDLGAEMCALTGRRGSSPTRTPSAAWSTGSSDWTRTGSTACTAAAFGARASPTSCARCARSRSRTRERCSGASSRPRPKRSRRDRLGQRR
jgi:glyoxylase-like metal-dependent hydrolase (beta-lactamase superfamily II)